MKKRLMFLILTIALILSLTACKTEKGGNEFYYDKLPTDEKVAQESNNDEFDKLALGEALTSEKLIELGNEITLSGARFFVPDSWVKIDVDGDHSIAYLVSVDRGESGVRDENYYNNIVFSSDEVEDENEEVNFEEYVDEYIVALNNSSMYRKVTNETLKIGNIDAKQLTFIADVDGKDAKICQTIFLKDKIIYFATYTSVEESFDSHIEEYENVVQTITF